jgi:hypothetical protein
MSSKTNQSSFNRLEKHHSFKQSNPGDLIDENVRQMHLDWQNCNPHDERFWEKLATTHGDKRREMLLAL